MKIEHSTTIHKTLLQVTGNEIDIKSGMPLYVQLKDLIKRRIAENKWKHSEMIPSENELSVSCGISIGTVKKALSVLVDERVLYRRQGMGTFVARSDFKRSFIRFFRYGFDEDNKGKFPSSRILKCKISKPEDRIKEILKLSKKDQVIIITRIRFLKNLPLVLEDIYLPHKVFAGFEKKDITQELLYPIYDTEYNTPIIWADEYLRPQIADENTAEVLGIEPGAPVIAIERIAHTIGDEPAEFRFSIGRGDRFRYHIEIR